MPASTVGLMTPPFSATASVPPGVPPEPLVELVGFVQRLLCATTTHAALSLVAIRDELLDMFRLLQAAVPEIEAIIADIRALLTRPDFGEPDLARHATRLGQLRDRLDRLLDGRARLLSRYPAVVEFWPDVLADKYEDLRNDVENLLEDAALRLSPEARATCPAAERAVREYEADCAAAREAQEDWVREGRKSVPWEQIKADLKL